MGVAELRSRTPVFVMPGPQNLWGGPTESDEQGVVNRPSKLGSVLSVFRSPFLIPALCLSPLCFPAGLRGLYMPDLWLAI